jgi:hypothetical protein
MGDLMPAEHLWRQYHAGSRQPKRVHEPKKVPEPEQAPKHRYIKRAVGVLAVALVTLIVTSAYQSVTTRLDPRPPFTAILEPHTEGSCESLVLGAPDPSTLPAREKFGPEWAYSHGGGTYDKIYWELTLQGRTDEAVKLWGLDVVDVERAPLPLSPAVVSTCDAGGGIFDVRHFDINFGDPHPKVVPEPGLDPVTDAIRNPAVEFPFTITKSDPELFYITVRGPDCLCSYRLSLEWSLGKKRHSLLIARDFGKIKTALIGEDEPLTFIIWRADGTWERRR